MSKFKIFIFWIVIVEILLILSTNRLYYIQNKDSDGKLYLVEARRLMKEIEEQKLGALEIEAMRFDQYKTLAGIREFVAGEACDNDYLVEEIASKLYRIEYIEGRSPRLPLYINLLLFGMMIVTSVPSRQKLELWTAWIMPVSGKISTAMRWHCLEILMTQWCETGSSRF
ncbi:MAG: hypothetical protein K2P42_18910 [Lachnospiraceae bacterium]|nr:hypothetical protein [Lachnospiraceae bacterium]